MICTSMRVRGGLVGVAAEQRDQRIDRRELRLDDRIDSDIPADCKVQ